MGIENRDKPSPARAAPPRRRARRLLAALALCGALALPVAQSGAQSIDELNSRIAGAREQAEALGAEIEAASAELAAAQRRAIAAAQREAQLSAVLARGQEREARLEAAVASRRRRARRRARAAPALARRALRPPGRDLPRRHARRDHRCCSSPTASTTSRPGPSTCAGSRRPTPRSSGGCARLRDAGRRSSSPRSRTPSDAPRPSTSGSPPPATRSPRCARRPRPRPRRSPTPAPAAQAALESLQSQVGDWTAEVQRLERISAQQAQQRGCGTGSATGRSRSRS